MKRFFLYLMFASIFISCTNNRVDDIVEKNPVKARSTTFAGTGDLILDAWNIQNGYMAETANNTFYYDIVYQNSHEPNEIYPNRDTYYCQSLYTVYLYNGAYDGYYGGYSLEWEYDNVNNIYIPESIPAQYGFVNREWDAYDGDTQKAVAAGETLSYTNYVTLPTGKTLSDIEYVLFFICDGTNGNNRYVIENDFYAE